MPSGRGPASNARRRLLTVAVVATLLVVGAELVGLPGVDRIRGLSGGALGPLERLLAPQRDSDLAAARDRVQRFDTALLRAATGADDAAEFAYRNGAPGTIDML